MVVPIMRFETGALFTRHQPHTKVPPCLLAAPNLYPTTHLKVVLASDTTGLDRVQEGPVLVQVVLDQGARQADEDLRIDQFLHRTIPVVRSMHLGLSADWPLYGWRWVAIKSVVSLENAEKIYVSCTESEGLCSMNRNLQGLRDFLIAYPLFDGICSSFTLSES